MKAFHDRPIKGDWSYLWVDATYLKARQAGRIVSVAVPSLSASTAAVPREVLGMAINASEANPYGPTSCAIWCGEACAG